MEFGPAVVEARLSRVPLVVLTADRPPELRDRGAPQTIDQDHLYGTSAKWYTELPLFDGDPATEAHVRSVAGRAVATAAAGPAGPVQVNVPFREPLLPDGPLAVDDGLDGAATPSPPRSPAPSPAARSSTTTSRASSRRSSAGPPGASSSRGRTTTRSCPRRSSAWPRATGFPILADPLSGLRTGPHDRSLVITRADQLVRAGGWIEGHRPDLVIRTGAMPTSKPILQLLEHTRPGLVVIDGDGGWREPALLPATFVHADAAATARALTVRARRAPCAGARGRGTGRMRNGPRPARWTRWLAALDEPFEGSPFPALAAALPDGAVLWAGNSMPVRDLDGWLPSTERAITVRSNRGANGIDGVVSTALGSAAVAQGPVALVVGDVSFLHDLNALLAAKLHGLSATIVLVNNDGGGIFSFLPQAQPGTPAGSGLPEHYEELFGTPHGVDLAPIVAALGGEHVAVAGHTDLAAAVADSVGRPGVRVIELRTDARPERRAASRRGGGRRACAGDGGARMTAAANVPAWAVRVHGSGRPLVLLHGFTGTGAAWDEHLEGLGAARRLIVADLPGHGGTPAASPDDASVERAADALAALLATHGAAPADVVGYSLGARVALRLAVVHPSAVARLVLESPSAGIEATDARAERRRADEALADRLERDGIEAFVDEWEHHPIFHTHAALPAGAPRPDPRDAPREHGVRARRQPARGRPGRDGAAVRPARAS